MTDEPPYLSVSVTGTTGVCHVCCFYVGAGNSDLCPKNHTADLLPTEPSPAVLCCCCVLRKADRQPCEMSRKDSRESNAEARLCPVLGDSIPCKAMVYKALTSPKDSVLNRNLAPS